MAATSASNAWAVGGYGSILASKTLIVHWNGTAWKQVPSPTPAGGVTLRRGRHVRQQRLGSRLH